MNERPTDLEKRALEHVLQAIAADDCRLQASPHVRMAVMRQWDEMRPAVRDRYSRRRLAAILAMGSLTVAVTVLVVIGVSRGPSQPHGPLPTAAGGIKEPDVAQHMSPVHPTRPTSAAHATVRHSRNRRDRGDTRFVSKSQQGLVLMMDPTFNDSTLSIVRVRVPRTALATLGVLPLDQNDSTLVDLEMLVGEDGAARMIRRVMPVAVRQE